MVIQRSRDKNLKTLVERKKKTKSNNIWPLPSELVPPKPATDSLAQCPNNSLPKGRFFTVGTLENESSREEKRMKRLAPFNLALAYVIASGKVLQKPLFPESFFLSKFF